MNRKIAFALAVGSAAAAAAAIVAATPGNAFAESLAEYTVPFAGSKSRADVQADLAAQGSAVATGSSEWKMQDNPPTPFKSWAARLADNDPPDRADPARMRAGVESPPQALRASTR